MKRLTEAQKKLVDENYKLVGWYINRVPKHLYKGDEDGFKQELSMGLIDAALTYDSARGGFATHAIWHFRSRISMWTRKNVRHSRLVFTDKLSLAPARTGPDREVEILRTLLNKLPEKFKREIPRCERLYLDYRPMGGLKYERQKAIKIVRDQLLEMLIKEGI